MSKSDYLENAYLELVFNGTPIANLADDAAVSPLTSLFLGLHTSDPTDSGNQATSEATYTGYQRVAVLRNGTGFIVTGNSVSPASNVDFPVVAAGAETETFWSVGVALNGATAILYSGPITPALEISLGSTPRLTSASTVTEN